MDGLMQDTWISKKQSINVPHKNLMWKVENGGGLKGTSLKWMDDYLQGREVRTVIRDTNSNVLEPNYGSRTKAIISWKT